MRSTHFEPDINERLLRCQCIYETFLRILPPSWPMQKQYTYALSPPYCARIELELMSKYTWRLIFEVKDVQKGLSLGKLGVQMYLDAKLAELVALEGRPVSIGPPLYPNAQGCYPDEKYQMDSLLLDWLLLIEKEQNAKS